MPKDFFIIYGRAYAQMINVLNFLTALIYD